MHSRKIEIIFFWNKTEGLGGQLTFKLIYHIMTHLYTYTKEKKVKKVKKNEIIIWGHECLGE